jgi:hypothetical protein
VPWCTDCDRWLAPPSVRADGTCPRCGTAVEPGKAHGVEALPPIPLSLKLLAAAVSIYLGFRGLQGVAWLVDHL